MKKLENKTYDSKREMEILDALEEVKSLNKRRQGFNPDRLLQEMKMKQEQEEQISPEDILQLEQQFLQR